VLRSNDLVLSGTDGEQNRDDGVKSTRERAAEKRQAKLDLVTEQVKNGSLVIRTMSEEERRRFPPRPPRPKKFGKR
jgi:hypothetical protein